MKTRGSWTAVVKFAGLTILVSSLLLLGVLRSAGKRTHPTGVGLSPVTASAATNYPRAKGDPQWIEAYGKLPLSFEENVGQTAQEVRFVSHGTGYGLFLTSQEAVISLQQSMPMNLSPLHQTAYFRALRKSRQAEKTTVLRMRLEGASSAPQIAGSDRLPGKVNYFIGNDPKNWRTDVPSYAQVKYEGIYPGVDLVFHGSDRRRLEYDFVVAPGADPKVIELSLKGAQKLRVNSNGDLVLSISGGQVALQKPVIYQNLGGDRHEIPGRYVLAGDRRVTFAVENYDRSAPLIIDPVLNYSTYLGGSAVGDLGLAIAVDSLGDAFVTGTTFSTTFPSTPGGFGAGNANGVAFVTEVNPAGTALLYTTYLGGTGGDSGLGIALDNSGSGANPGGNVYVTGQTFSSDFPTPTNGGIAPLKAGPNLAAATLGTSFISKLNPAASGPPSLVYSSYLGGTNGTSIIPDVGNAVAADVNGNAYVTGLTSASPGSGLANFPITTASAFQTALGTTNGNAFLTRIDTTQSGSASLAYSTYLGGSGANAVTSTLGFGEQAQGVAVDASKNAYVIGTTTSTDFPMTSPTPNGFQIAAPAAIANGTVFVARIDTSTTKAPAASLVYSTYLGGNSQDLASAIALKPNSGVVYVTGETISLLFPTFPKGPLLPYQTTGSAGGTAFLSLIDTGQSGSASLTYSTFLGGATTSGFGIAVDATGNSYVAGGTSSSIFPVTPGAFQPKFATGAQGEGFISKINPGGNGTADLVYSSLFGGSGIVGGPDAIRGIAVDSLNNAYITGLTFSSAATFPVFPPATAVPPAFQTSLPSGDHSAAFVAKLTLIPTLMVSPAPGSTLDFGTVLIGTTSAAKTVTLTNNTNAAIPFTSAAVTGANKADFTATPANCSPNITTTTPCTVSVTFKPSVVGPETATLTLTDGDSTSPQVFSLKGSGTNIAPDFTITATAPTPSPVKAGMSATFTVTVTPVGGFSSAVTIACTEPAALTLSTCTAAQSPITPNGGAVMTVVTVTTTAPSLVMPPPSRITQPLLMRQIVPLLLALILLFLLPTAQRRRLRLGMAAATLALLVLAGCSGSGTPPKPGTPPGTYALTVTGTSGATMHTVTPAVSVTVD
jgi:hypothetical protein